MGARCREPSIASEGGADSTGGAASQGGVSPGGGAGPREDAGSGRGSGGAAVSGRLHFHHPALRRLSLARPAPLDLFRRVQTEIGMARALVGQLSHAEHHGLEGRTDDVQQVRERRIARPLAGGAARGAYPPEVGEVRLDRRRQLRVCSRHYVIVPVAAEGSACASPALSASTVTGIAPKGDRTYAHHAADAAERSEDGNLNFDVLGYERDQVYLHM